MTEIYLIRHAQAEGNIYRTMQGHWDGDLTERGRAQVSLLAERLRDVRFDAVYSSSLYRAMLTATAITKYNPELRIIPRDELREIDVGPWERRFFGDLTWEAPESSRLFMYDSEKWYLEGAETFHEVGLRGLRALKEISEECDGQRIAVVSHGITIRSMLSVITGLPLSDTVRLPISGNTSISRLTCENGTFKLNSFNDTAHLSTQEKWDITAPSLRGYCESPEKFREEYLACYMDSWREAHGNLEGFEPEPYIQAAIRHYSRNSGSIVRLFDGEKEAGLLDMDTEKGREQGIGWISLLYLKPEYRGRNLGIQALARAIMFYSGEGRRALELNVAEDNLRARSFYEKYGFREISSQKNGLGRLFRLKKDLGHGEIL